MCHVVVHLLGSQANVFHPIVHRFPGELLSQLILSHRFLKPAHKACCQIGRDLSHGNFRACRSQNMIGRIGAMHARQPADTVIHLSQVPPHGQTVFRHRHKSPRRNKPVSICSQKLYIGQAVHNVVRRHIDAIPEAVGHQRAVRLGGRNQMAHLNRRLLGLDFKATIILPEPVIRVPQAHQIVQLLHGRVSVAVVIIDPNGLRGHLGLAGDHIRKEEKAHHIGRLCPPHILQRFLHDIAGVQEAAAAGAAGNAGKNIHVQFRTSHSLQCLCALGLNG